MTHSLNRTFVFLLTAASLIAISVQFSEDVTLHKDRKNHEELSKVFSVQNNEQKNNRFKRATRKPGFFRTLFSVVYEQWNDTRHTMNKINSLVNDNFLPENAPRVETTTSGDPNATTTKAPYKITRTEFNRIVQRNLRGLARLYNIELRDALKTEATIKNVFIRRHRSKKKLSAVECYKRDLQIDDHLITLEELVARLNTDLQNGVSSNRAKELQARDGPNLIKPKHYVMKMFVTHLFHNFAALLWLGILICSLGFCYTYYTYPNDQNYDQVYLAVVLFIIILVTGFYGLHQERRHGTIRNTYQKIIPILVHVIRDGVLVRINSNELVVGDLVSLRSGDCVPADMRIIQSMDLFIDVSTIIDASEPQLKSSELTDLNPLATKNMAYKGMHVVSGRGMGVIIATGNNTCIGHISTFPVSEGNQSSIRTEVTKFARRITAFAVIVGLSFFLVAFCLQYDSFNPLMVLIAISLVLLPEGLLVTVTAALSLTAKKMYKRNFLCKNLTAIEKLGYISVLCLDKVGLITKNKMLVSHIYFDDEIRDPYETSFSQGFYSLCLAGILCSRADFMEGPSTSLFSKKFISTDQKDIAIFKYLDLVTGRQATSIKREHYQVFEIPFDLTFEYQLSIHTIPDKTRMYLAMTGSPDVIIEYCSWMNASETVEILTEGKKIKLKQILRELSYSGEFIIGYADRVLPENYTENYDYTLDPLNFPINELRFLGMISVLDPPSMGVKRAVSKCHRAGIKIIMITDDAPVIAMALAKKVGIVSLDAVTVFDIAMQRQISASKVTEQEIVSCRAVVIDANDENNMTDGELDHALYMYDEIVFANMLPEQKLNVVDAYKRAGYVVGVSAENVQALQSVKRADIGIAMGETGDDVIRDAADIIVVDDSMEAIVNGIEEGRLIYDNIRKSITYVLSSKLPEVAPFLLHVTCNIPMPLGIIGIILIDVTDLWPSISIVYESSEADIMDRPPRNILTKRLVTMRMVYFAHLIIGVLQTFAGLSCWFFAMSEYGFLPNLLLGIREEWYSSNNDVRDSYNQSWSIEERRQLEMKGYAAYFLGVVVTQLADCIIIKTRRQSILRQGMANTVMNFALLFEIFFALLVVYCPYVNNFFSFTSVHIYILLPAIPYALCIILLDELRKGFIRNKPNGWFARETYF